MADNSLDEILADIAQREPDFYGRCGVPIWCAREPSLDEIRDLMQSEGVLVPSERMHQFMLAHGCWKFREKS